MRFRRQVLTVVLGIGLGGFQGVGEAQESATPTPKGSRVTRLDITSRGPAFGGRSFGAVGAYEILLGTATAVADPGAPPDAGIVDLENAPRNADGLVEYTFEVDILKPVDVTRGNGVLVYEINNRGRNIVFGYFPRGGAGLRGRERRQRVPHGPGLHLRLERLAARRAGRRRPASGAGDSSARHRRRPDDYRHLDGGVAEPGQRRVREVDLSGGDARRDRRDAHASPAPGRSAPDGSGRPMGLRRRHDGRSHAPRGNRRGDHLRVRVRGPESNRSRPGFQRHARFRVVRALSPRRRSGRRQPALRGRHAGARPRGGRRFLAERPDGPGTSSIRASTRTPRGGASSTA